MQCMEFAQHFPKSQLGIRNPGYVNVVLSKHVISRLFPAIGSFTLTTTLIYGYMVEKTILLSFFYV